MREPEFTWQFPKVLRSAVLCYASGVGAFVISFCLREALDPWLFADRGFIVFLPAIAVIAYAAGLGPAIVTAALSGITVWYFFIPPFHTFKLDAGGTVGLLTFVLGSAVTIVLVHRLRAERESAQSDLSNMARLCRLSQQLVRERTDVNECLNEVLETAIAISGADKGNVQLFNMSSDALTIAAQRGFKDAFLTYFENVHDVASSACAAAMRSAAQVIVEDVLTSEVFVGQPSQKVLLDADVRAVISAPLTSSTGQLLGMVSTHFSKPHRPSERQLYFVELLTRQTADYLERKRAEDIQNTLNREVQHRSNNLLGVIQAMAHRSLSGDYSLAQARETFEARLQALARANRQLIKSNWRGVSLREIVRSELAPFADRINVEGMDVLLNPKNAQNFALALHELATNATKYGGLSAESGRVKVSWLITHENKENSMRFRWQESGGPAVVAPTRRGFGTMLLKTAFPNIVLDYAIEGFNCQTDVLLGDVEQGEIAAS
jgi:two-component sensor histidine kinase/membrane protein implicated in regulation of membrane protease activity